jgi:hypothetical protein
VALVAAVCAFALPGQAQDRPPPFLPEPLPDLVFPRPFGRIDELVPQINAIVEGSVADIRFDYDDCWGPGILVRLRDVRSLIGEPHEPETELRVFGGFLPNGRFVSDSDAPRYVLGGRYVLILRNTDWRFSPVIGNLAFRRETIAGREMLVDTDGHPVSGVTEAGIRTDLPPVTGIVGLKVAGRDVSDTDRQDALRDPVGPAGEVRPCPEVDGRFRCEPDPSAQVDRQREWIEGSGLFAPPAVLEDIDTAVVERAIPADELVGRLAAWADEHGIRIGGYYAERPRIGCWGTTPTSPQR